MAKLFGEFLIEKNLATTEQVLTAVITQLRSVPSTAEVIFDYALLPATDQLRILAHQQYSGADFRTSAAALSFWNGELAAKVASQVQAKRRPLGEVLVELGFMSIDSLSQALDSYVESSATPVQPLSHAPKLLNAEYQAAPVTRPSESSLDPILIKEFVENFETVISPALNAAAQIFEETTLSQNALTATLRSTLSEFVALRAASSFMSALHAEGLAKEAITTLETVLNSINADHSAQVDTSILRDILKLAQHVFDGICQLLREFGSEDGMDADPNLTDLTQRFAKAQERLRAQCNGARRVA